MKILKQVNLLKPKVIKLRDFEKDLRNLKDEIYETEKKILKVYKIVFKNFISRRTKTEIKYREDRDKVICLNINGFSLISSWGNNSDYVEDFEELNSVLKKEKEINKRLQKVDKIKLVKVFSKEFSKLQHFKRITILKLPKSIEFLTPKIEEDEAKKILGLRFRNEIEFFEDEERGSWGNEHLSLSRMRLRDCLLIEQFYPQIMELYRKHKKTMLKMKKERWRMLQKLQKTFSTQLVLQELKIN